MEEVRGLQFPFEWKLTLTLIIEVRGLHLQMKININIINHRSLRIAFTLIFNYS